MSTIGQKGSIGRLDARSIERGIEEGRRLRTRAFGAVLTSLFSWMKAGKIGNETVIMPDCAAA